MPKVVVTGICNACGKPFERKFYFESKEAALAWENSDSAKNQICEECDEERKDKRAAEHRIQMTANGMAELEGSPKQIAWAEKIRATFFENAEEMWRGAVEAIDREESYGESSERIKAKLKFSEPAEKYLLTKVSSASWWIENRIYLTDPLVVDAELASVYRSHKEEIEAMESPEGEPVEETAESNEEAKMNRAKELVEKYNFQLKMKEESETLVPSGNIYTVSVKQVTKDGTLDEIKSLKPEMLKILMDRYNQRQQQVYQC